MFSIDTPIISSGEPIGKFCAPLSEYQEKRRVFRDCVGCVQRNGCVLDADCVLAINAFAVVLHITYICTRGVTHNLRWCFYGIQIVKRREGPKEFLPDNESAQ